jgi:hypothetical protein
LSPPGILRLASAQYFSPNAGCPLSHISGRGVFLCYTQHAVTMFVGRSLVYMTNYQPPANERNELAKPRSYCRQATDGGFLARALHRGLGYSGHRLTIDDRRWTMDDRRPTA